MNEEQQFFILLLGFMLFGAALMIIDSTSSEESKDSDADSRIDRNRFIMDHARFKTAIHEADRVQEFGAKGLRKQERIFEDALYSVSSDSCVKSLRELRNKAREIAEKLELKGDAK
jgi:hypothetical protein